MANQFLKRIAGLLFSIFASNVFAQQCYYPDGSRAHDKPCSSADNTHCCYETDICLSNGYCLSLNADIYVPARGSCTDYNWESPCPQNCIDSNYDAVGSGNPIVYLRTANGKIEYCCGSLVVDGDSVGCAHNRTPFTLSDSRLLYGYALLENATLTNSASNTTTGSSSDPTATATASKNKNSCEDEVEKIGIGVGVPLGIIALLAAAWGFWERRKRLKALSTAVAGRDHLNEPVHLQDKPPTPRDFVQPGQSEHVPVVELQSVTRPIEM